MRIGVLTGGGDCPGLNAALRAIVRHGEALGHSLVGFRHGWRGVTNGEAFELQGKDVRNVLSVGGTILGTVRYHPTEDDGGMDRVLQALKSGRIDALICLGGDGTIGVSADVAAHGVPVVSIPKTIDNDVAGTDRSIGFDTAVYIATEAIDRVHTTAESHDRVMVVEVMGRHAGWIAVSAGIAGGADCIAIPEQPFTFADMCDAIQRRHRSNTNYSIVVVAEGARPRPEEPVSPATVSAATAPQQAGDRGHLLGSSDGATRWVGADPVLAGQIGGRVAERIALTTGYETRLVVLGHTQRGGAPTATDRLLASRFGVAAVDAVCDGRLATMTALVGDEVIMVPLDAVAGRTKLVPEDLRRVAYSLL